MHPTSPEDTTTPRSLARFDQRENASCGVDRADTPSSSILKQLLKGEGGAAETRCVGLIGPFTELREAATGRELGEGGAAGAVERPAEDPAGRPRALSGRLPHVVVPEVGRLGGRCCCGWRCCGITHLSALHRASGRASTSPVQPARVRALSRLSPLSACKQTGDDSQRMAGPTRRATAAGRWCGRPVLRTDTSTTAGALSSASLSRNAQVDSAASCCSLLQSQHVASQPARSLLFYSCPALAPACAFSPPRFVCVRRLLDCVRLQRIITCRSAGGPPRPVGSSS